VSTTISPLAGKPAPASLLVDVPKLLAAYVDLRPDPKVPAQRVAFGTSGHRGSSFERSFNERHVLAISQAICEYRKGKGIVGPLYIGIDTHALSQPAFESALEVLAANGVETMIAEDGEFMQSWSTTVAARRGWPTVSSSLPRTIRPTTAASSTTRRTAARPIPTSPAGSRIAPMRCSKAISKRSDAHHSRRRVAPPVRTRTISSTST
jgi:hypothetical protein